MMKEDNHIFQGLRRDNHQIRQESKFLWDAHNIRITNRDDSTLFSITNEKGTSNPLVNLSGYYVGHCVLGKYLIVFTSTAQKHHTENSIDTIYRIEKISNTYKTIVLFSGYLGIGAESPIEAIGDYEGEFIQKVYWIDGVNQPRVINIAKPELEGATLDNNQDASEYYNVGTFNFIQELQLKETVEVTKNFGGGTFSPGVIQYAFTYYNKYGQESNIFHTTQLQYISPQDRGSSPEETVSNSFNIKVSQIDSNFEYLRIYSIHRTSIDAVPTVLRLKDFPIGTNGEIEFTDTGTIGDTVDPTKLLYIGGEEIYAGAICHKDGTLFLGDIRIIRPSTLSKDERDYIRTLTVDTNLLSNSSSNNNDNVNNNGYYRHYNNLGTTPGFKSGETYRLGLQFQHSSGRWSDPVFVKDESIPINIRPSSDGKIYSKPIFEITLDEQSISYIKNKKYKNVRALIVPPSVHDRKILAQGMLCPTVFNVESRRSNTPFSQSSWFLRPNLNSSISDWSNSSNILEGAFVEFRHLHSLFSGHNRGAEIQCNSDTPQFSLVNTYVNTNNDIFNDVYMVDQSIITFHSPDIEWDTRVTQSMHGQQLKMRIVGLINFTSNIGDINIKTSSPTIGKNSSGFNHRSLGCTTSGGRSLVSGIFYRDYLVDEDKDSDGNFTKFGQYSKEKNDFGFMVYPWHRTGSLNNDINRPGDTGVRSAVLSKKIISNLKFSSHNTWLNSPWEADSAAGITPIQVFNSNELSLIKIQTPKNSGITTINYYGNVDSMVSVQRSYPSAYFSTESSSGTSFVDTSLFSVESYNKTIANGDIGDGSETLIKTTDPAIMKYKSSPHAVFALNYSTKGSPWILPSVNSLNTENLTTVPFWSDIDKSSIIVPTNYKKIDYIEIGPSEGIIEPTIGKRRVISGIFNNGNWAERIEEFDGENWNVVTDTVSYFKYEPKNIWWKIKSNSNEYYAERVSFDTDDTLYDVKRDNITVNSLPYPYLFLAELYRDSVINQFGGDSDEALQNNIWIPASDPYNIEDKTTLTIQVKYGDTWYSRYDCLKTYPFTPEDQNQIVEIGSFMCETRVNIDGRYDRNRGQVSNLYMTPQNFNLLNEVYSQHNNFFNYRILDDKYYKQTYFANQITWSTEKQAANEVDPWTNVTLANTLDIDGSKGKIVSIDSFNNTLLCFQEKAINQIMFNSRVQIPSSDGVPIEISNGYKVDGSRLISDSVGCQNKWSISSRANNGIFFIDNNTDSIWLFNGELTNISESMGMKWWIKDNHCTKEWNPYNSNAIRTFYDSIYKDIYFTPGPNSDKDALCYSEQLGSFISQMSYGGTQAMFNFEDGFYSLRQDSASLKLYQNNIGMYNSFYGEDKGWNISFISNDNPTYTKIFDTIDMRADYYLFIPDIQKLLNSSPITYIGTQNEYQYSRAEVDNRNMRKKFRIWRATIPRNNGTRQRIRNPWTMLTLGWEPDLSSALVGVNNKKAVLHDITVRYTI